LAYVNSKTRRAGRDSETDWVLRATWQDYQLTPESPIHPILSTHPRPTPLLIDLHDGIEVGIMLRGKQERHYPDVVVELTAGDVWLQPMWEPHGWRAVVPDTENIVLIFLPPFLGEEMLGGISWLSLFAAPPQLRPWVRDHKLRTQALAVGREMAEEISTQPRGWLTAVRIGLIRLLFLLSRYWDPPAQPSEGIQITPSTLSRIMPAIALIQARRPGTVSVEEAAAACGLSRSRFGTIFRQTLGSSFGQFSLRARLGYAAHRLLTTNLSIDAIAQKAGFVDASHFHRTFVKHYGCTPREYRARAT
jgi:AraC-like DNA-binding protein